MKNRLRSLLTRWIFVLATGYTLVFFSELLFWGTTSLAAFVATWIFYSLVAYLFLAVISRFHVNRIWPLFLAGALYGWLVEGVLVSTTYENLPVSISDTGLSWHALLTILIGWYAMRRTLSSSRPYRALLLAAGIGVLWGVWMPLWGFLQEPGVNSPTLLVMVMLSVTAVPLLAVSYWLQNKLAVSWTPHRLETGIIIGLLLLQFFFVIVPTIPLAALVLPLLLFIVYLGLRRHRRHYPQAADFTVTLTGPTSMRNYLAVLAMIPAALLAFTAVQALNLTPIPQYAIYAVTIPTGFLLLIVSLFQIWREGRQVKKSETPLPGQVYW